VNYIHEEGRADRPGGEQDVIGVDVVARLSESTEVRAEYAVSKDKQESGETIDAAAYLAEIVHTSDDFSAQAYIREEEAGFGVGQQSSNTNGIRRYGVDASYVISEDIQEDTGRRMMRNITAQSYVEQSLETGAKRTLSEVAVTQDSDTFGGGLGLRHVKEDIAAPLQLKRLSACVTKFWKVKMRPVRTPRLALHTARGKVQMCLRKQIC